MGASVLQFVVVATPVGLRRYAPPEVVLVQGIAPCPDRLVHELPLVLHLSALVHPGCRWLAGDHDRCRRKRWCGADGPGRLRTRGLALWSAPRSGPSGKRVRRRRRMRGIAVGMRVDEGDARGTGPGCRATEPCAMGGSPKTHLGVGCRPSRDRSDSNNYLAQPIHPSSPDSPEPLWLPLGGGSGS